VVCMIAPTQYSCGFESNTNSAEALPSGGETEPVSSALFPPLFES
jgi:hypothetical protein